METSKDYIDWLVEDTLEEGPLGDIAHMGKRAAQRAALAAKSIISPNQADGDFDIMDVTAKIRNHYLRDTKAIGKPYTMQTLADFLAHHYGISVDPRTGQVLDSNPRASAATTDGTNGTNGTSSNTGSNTGSNTNFRGSSVAQGGSLAAEPQKPTPPEPATDAPSGTAESQADNIASEFWEWITASADGSGRPLTEYEPREITQDLDRWIIKYEDLHGEQYSPAVYRALHKKIDADIANGKVAVYYNLHKHIEAGTESDTLKPKSDKISDNVGSSDGMAALQQAVMLMMSPRPDAKSVMAAIQRSIIAVKRDNNPQEKKFVANKLRALRDDGYQRKVPQLADLTDEMLNRLAENWVRMIDCAIYLVEAEVREPRLVREAVECFFEDMSAPASANAAHTAAKAAGEQKPFALSGGGNRFNPNAKIDRATMDGVFTDVAKHLLATRGGVDFGEQDRRPHLAGMNRGNANAHVRGAPGGLEGLTAARTGYSTSAPTSGAGPSHVYDPATDDADGDGEEDATEQNTTSRLDSAEFEKVLEEFGLSGQTISQIFADSYRYRNDPEGLIHSFNTPEEVTRAKQIAAAAMVSILVNLK